MCDSCFPVSKEGCHPAWMGTARVLAAAARVQPAGPHARLAETSCGCGRIHVLLNAAGSATSRLGRSTAAPNVRAGEPTGQPTGCGVPPRGGPEPEPPLPRSSSRPLGPSRSALAAAGRWAQAALRSFSREREEGSPQPLSFPLRCPPGLAVWRGGRAGVRLRVGAKAACFPAAGPSPKASRCREFVAFRAALIR